MLNNTRNPTLNWLKSLLLGNNINPSRKTILSSQNDLISGMTYHSARHQVENANTGLNRKQYTATVFLDIEKAFVKVWIFGLIQLYYLPLLLLN